MGSPHTRTCFLFLRLFVFVFVNGFIWSPLFGQRKQLYIANDDHTDYFWTADDVTYRQAFINQLDYYIGLMELHNDTLPPPYQHRYNCDNSLWVYEYEKAKSPADFARLMDKIKSGHISVPFNPLVPVYGAQNTEIALRGMYYGGYLERTYGIDIDLAVMMENQTLPLGISSLWAGAGAKYSWKGICSCASPYLEYHDRELEVYYARGLDGEGVLMKWYDLITNQHLGGYAECRFPNAAIDDLSEKCDSEKYPYLVAGAFGYGWDDLENYIDFFPERARAKTNASQQVHVSNQIDFFQQFQAYHGGDHLPVQSVSFGNDWDLLVATMAQVSGDVRRAAEKLRAAEAMATLVSLHDPSFADDLIADRELAFISLGKYYDHDWTADGPVSHLRAQFQRDMASNFSSYVDALYSRSQEALGDLIASEPSSSRFYVFNPLGWTRTDVADIPYTGRLPVTVFDRATRQEVPSQVMSRAGVQFVRVLASDIPSVGYKVYELVEDPSSFTDPAAGFKSGYFSNDHYAFAVSPSGSIPSFYDQDDAGFDFRGEGPLNSLASGDPDAGGCVVESSGSVSVTIACESKSPVGHTTRYTLFKNIDRVDIENEIHHDVGNQTLLFDFPFGFEQPDVWHEEVGAVLLDKTEDAGGHYSNRNARYDWQTANHFVHMGDGVHGITISNLGSHFFKLGNSTIEQLDQNSSLLRMLATGKVGFGTIGINNQGGDTAFFFQYALQTHSGAFDQTASMKMAMEHQNPLVTGFVGGAGVFPDSLFSLLSIDQPDILLWALKPAEDGADQGIIARFWNQSEASPLILESTYPVLAATQTSHVETDMRDAVVTDNHLEEMIGSQQIRTYRLFLSDTIISGLDVPDEIVSPFRLYPNPCRSWLSIESGSSLVQSVRIYAMDQRLVFQTHDTTGPFDISHLPSGVYSVVWTAESLGVWSRLLIKQ